MKFILPAIVILLSILPQSQLIAQRSCGSPVVTANLLDSSKTFRKNKNKIVQFQEEFRREYDEPNLVAVITIPVVVHVVYKNESEKISPQVVADQIKRLSDDFNARNRDISSVPEKWKSLVTDTDIEFRLANRNPRNEKTDGIVYVRTNTEKFYMLSENVKKKSRGGDDPWDTEHYLNIWVCDLDKYLGYAFPPGASRQQEKERGGVVIRYDIFGINNSPKYGLGRTVTHEVGHWLGLAHIWGECGNQDPCCAGCQDDDGIPDTPVQDKCNEGQIDSNNPPKSCQNDGDLYVNFLDYVDDNVMVMFTTKQSVWMQGVLQSTRHEILRSKGLVPITSSNLFFQH